MTPAQIVYETLDAVQFGLLLRHENLAVLPLRVLNLTILVPSKRTVVIPVSCVEAGRWHPSHRIRRRRLASSSQRAAPRRCAM